MTSEATKNSRDQGEAGTTTVDVVVVGLGPVGITLCNILASHGLRVIGLDSAEEVYDLPRAIGMDHEVMRVFQGIGVADALAPCIGEYRPSEYRSADGRLLRRLESPGEPYPLGWPPYLTFLQPDLERVLRERGKRHPNLSTRVSTDLVTLENPDAPTLTIRDNRTGRTETIRPRFVVGCDGGNSFVRRTLGIEFEDLIFDEPWVVVDVLLDDPTVSLPDTNVQYCDPRRPHTHVVGPGNLRRWEFMVLPGEDPAALNQPNRIWQLLSPWLRPDQGRLWRSAAYNFHALVAQEWRRGNVFLAGDACHMTPPFLAQGMVQGIKDAVNLGWKLAFAQKQGSNLLLDSYQSERRPVVRQVIWAAKDLGHVICELDPQKADIRNTRMISEVEQGKGLWMRQDLFPPISAGFIGQLSDGAPAPGAGKPSPQPWIVNPSGRQRLDDVVGTSFAILTNTSFSLSAALTERALELGFGIHTISLKDGSSPGIHEEEHSVFADWLSAHKVEAILVRPDQIVFGGARDPDGLLALVEQVQSMLNDRPCAGESSPSSIPGVERV